MSDIPPSRKARPAPATFAEFDFNLRLAQRIEEKLKAEGFAETRLLVTEGKARPSLVRRVDAANNLQRQSLPVDPP